MRPILWIAMAVLAALAAAGVDGAGDVTVSVGGRGKFSFTDTGTGYVARSGNLSVAVHRQGEAYMVTGPRGAFKLKKKDESYKLRAGNGDLVFKVKLKEGKVKIMRAEDEHAPWEIKNKGDHLKVMKGDTLYGNLRVRGGQVVVTGPDGSEVARTFGVRLRYAPAVVLFRDLDELDRLFLFAILCLVDG